MSMKKRAALAQTNYADVVGIQVDYENVLFQRLAGARGKRAGTAFDRFSPFGGRRKCCVADNGAVNAFYGESGYTEDGSAGQVMVYQPRFYYRVEPLVLAEQGAGPGSLLKKARYYVSGKPLPGFKLHPAFYREDGSPADHIFFSAYDASYYDASLGKMFVDGTDTDPAIDLTNDRLCSLPQRKPITGTYKSLTRSSAEQLAGARGAGWHIETIKICAAEQLLMLVEYGAANLQSALAQGIVRITDRDGVNCASLTGSCAPLGNGSGVASSTVNEQLGVTTVYSENGKTAVCYRGKENPWGQVWRYVQGINVASADASAPAGVYVADDFAFDDHKKNGNYRCVGITLPESSGYLKYPGYAGGEFDWLFLPAAVGGNSTRPVGDYAFAGSDDSGDRIVAHGGRWMSGYYSGPFCYNFQREAAYSAYDYGCRLVYIP